MDVTQDVMHGFISEASQSSHLTSVCSVRASWHWLYNWPAVDM